MTPTDLRAKHLKSYSPAPFTPVSRPGEWLDHNGVTRKVPGGLKKFSRRSPRYAALTAFVFIRDLFTCQRCDAKPRGPAPIGFNGRAPVRVFGRHGWRWLVVDHIVSRRNGGSNHPSNLQALCDGCNSRKAGTDDAKHPAALERRRLSRS